MILQLELSAGTFDLNVTPDKRTIFLHGEREIVDWLRVAMEESGVLVDGIS